MFIEIESCVFEIGRTLIGDYFKKSDPGSSAAYKTSISLEKEKKWLAIRAAEDYPERN